MNKRRIREPFHTLIWKASIGYNDSWSQVDPEVLEKFAKLIVRECVYVSEGYFGFKDHTPGTAIANEIKQHFGVEQDLEEDSNETCPRCGVEWSGTSCGLPECGWVVGGEE